MRIFHCQKPTGNERQSKKGKKNYSYDNLRNIPKMIVDID